MTIDTTHVGNETTNESLKSIVKGMEPGPSDVIIAIGGSGDQAFALLEEAGEVRVVDENSYQIDYIRKRCETLRQGYIDGFLGIKLMEKRTRYLSKKQKK